MLLKTATLSSSGLMSDTKHKGVVKKSKNEQNTRFGIQPVWCSARFSTKRVDYFRWLTEEEA